MRARLCLCLLCCGLLLPCAAEDWSFLNSFPKINRPTLQSLIAEQDAMRSTLLRDRDLCLAEERDAARKALMLAAILDDGSLDASAFSLASALAGLSSGPPEKHLPELSTQRRLRWEASQRYANAQYGHTTKRGPALAASQNETLRKQGQALAAQLKPLLGAYRRAALDGLRRALEERFAQHPDCPQRAFSELRAAAATLDNVRLRPWILALCLATPQALAGFPRSEEASQEAFDTALAHFETESVLLLSLRSAVPAAAACAWYGDSVINRSSSGPRLALEPYAPASGAALESLAACVRNLALADPDALSRILSPGSFSAADAVTSAALAELSGALWLLRDDEAFRAATGLEPEAIERFLTVCWKAALLAPSEPQYTASEDFPAVVAAAERRAAFLESLSGPALLATAARSLGEVPEVAPVVARASRYASLRDRVVAARRAVRAEAEAAARAALASSELPKLLARIAGLDPVDIRYSFEWHEEEPLGVWRVGLILEAPRLSGTLRLPVPASLYASSLANRDALGLRAELPSVASGAFLSLMEILVTTGGPFKAGGDFAEAQAYAAWTAGVCARLGVPIPFITTAGPDFQSLLLVGTLSRLADSAGGKR